MALSIQDWRAPSTSQSSFLVSRTDGPYLMRTLVLPDANRARQARMGAPGPGACVFFVPVQLLSPPNDGSSPGESCPKASHGEDLPLFDASGAHGFVERDGDAGRGGVAVLVEV